jgi:hypothetical protein
MDCEKFDLCAMDALYGELDELTHEALKRHVEGCARCGAAWSGFKATRNLLASASASSPRDTVSGGSTLPLDDPSPELERRILAAERTAHRGAPWHRKIMRGAAWAGSHAMRPQLAMAALFMFVIGSSLLLLRARPGTMAPPVLVSEQGRPEREAETQTLERGNRAGGAAMTAATKGALAESDRDDRPAPAAAPNDEGLVKGGAPTSAASAFGGPESAGEPKVAMPSQGCSDAELAVKLAVKQADKKLAKDALAACRKGDGGPGMPAAPVASDPQATATATASTKPGP